MCAAFEFVQVVPSGIPCCGMAGDRGMRFPELTGASLQHLNLPKECKGEVPAAWARGAGYDEEEAAGSSERGVCASCGAAHRRGRACRGDATWCAWLTCVSLRV